MNAETSGAVQPITSKKVDLDKQPEEVQALVYSLYTAGLRAYSKYRRTNQLFWMSVACNVVLILVLNFR